MDKWYAQVAVAKEKHVNKTSLSMVGPLSPCRVDYRDLLHVVTDKIYGPGSFQVTTVEILNIYGLGSFQVTTVEI